MTQLMQANKQWSSRPDDQRFLSLIELDAYVQAQRANSAAKIVSSRALTVHPVEGDAEALMLTGPNGAPVNITNWSFGQLAARAGAPAGYMRDLPAPLAADCLNYFRLLSRSPSSQFESNRRASIRIGRSY